MSLLCLKDEHVVSYANWIINNRILVIVLCLCLLIISSLGLSHIGFNTNYRVFFGEENPQLQDFDAFQRIFTKSDSIIIVVKANDGVVFDKNTLPAIQWITSKAWTVPYSTKVDSITNFQHTYARGDELIVEDLISSDPAMLSQSELLAKKMVATTDPLLVNRLINPDASATGINITFQIPQESNAEVPKAVSAVRQIVEEAKELFPEHHYALSGTVMMNNAFSEASVSDLERLVPIMYLVLIIGMIFFLRSLIAVVAALLLIAMATLGAMGLTGWLGIDLTPPSATAPTIVLTLAIADSVHFLIAMFKEMVKGKSQRAAIIESLRINFSPIFLTSLTTTIGFLSLNFSDAPPFHDLGNITAMGVMLAFILSISFLPALMSLFTLRMKPIHEVQQDAMEKFGRHVVEHKTIYFYVMVVVFAALVTQVFRLDLNDQFVRYFDKTIDFRTDTDFMDKELTGVYQVEYVVGSNQTNGVSNPNYLKHLEQFTEWLRKQPEVVHVYSLTDIYKRLNKNMHADDDAYYDLPNNAELAAQYLLLYELSLPFGLDINDRINVDKSSSRLSVTLKDSTTKEMRAFEARSQLWQEDNLPDYMISRGTSPSVMFSYISERNINSMIKGNITAFLLISLCIGFMLRSTRLGIISLAPNLMPAIMAFGLWGLLVGQVNMAIATIAAVSLGIIVDDTVHLLSKYQRGRDEKGLTGDEAIVYAFSMCGNALLITTVVLVAGFSVLAFSAFSVNASMGLLTAIAIAMALITDFLLLPALLTKFAPDTLKKEVV